MSDKMQNWTWKKNPENVEAYERGCEAGRSADCYAGDCPHPHWSTRRMPWIDGFSDGRAEALDPVR